MHTTTGGVAVVTTTLAQTDRRALSQAWYSALHLAQAAQPRAATSAHAVPVAGSGPARSMEVRSASQPRASADAARVSPRTAPRIQPPGVAAERREQPGVLGRRIAKVVARPAAGRDAARAATVCVRGARVHVIVRTLGSATRIVALCPAPLEARVARALAQARFALAAHGVRVEAGT
jgi:hypothetical protein